MTSNIEGALNYSPLPFAYHLKTHDAVYTAFMVETHDTDAAGGFLRRRVVAGPEGKGFSTRLSVVEVVEEGPKRLPRGACFSTNAAIFELEPLVMLASRHHPKIAIEPKSQPLEGGGEIDILRGKTGQSGIIDQMPSNRSVGIVCF